jgi:EAL domain-containing protein (putative c-di-GMP-specific phosphodiesterase class I)
VLSALAETRLDPRRLELEITETVLLGDEVAILAALHSLKALGVRISMDDFGTGFSSLTYLQSFPFDKIKVDRSFITGRSTGGGGALVRAVAAMGRSMGVPIVAEGVETAEQLAFVEADGCTDAQGFFVGRPAPAAELARYFADASGERRDR